MTSAAFGAIVAFAMATGDPRVGILLSWPAGSTYQVDAMEAAFFGCVAAALMGAPPILSRWLDVLPLGEPTARALGLDVDVDRCRLVILLATALMTTVATLIVGPLSFVGLMAPHMARLTGYSRASMIASHDGDGAKRP